MSKTALVCGITGQDGSYLAEYLLSLGYTVHGLVRRRATPGQDNLAHLTGAKESGRLYLHQGDITDATAVRRVFEETAPDEVYNCAAQSHLGTSWDCPVETTNINAVGPLNILEALRWTYPKARLYLAGTVEFLDQDEPPLDEYTRIEPYSPYAVAKAASFELARIYRDRYGLHVSTAILANHTSERRPESFVTRKITAGIARIVRGEQDRLTLGDIDSPLDIGYAPDFVKAFHIMLQQPKGGDYCIATGERHTLRDFATVAMEAAGQRWQDWWGHIVQDAALIRPMQTRHAAVDTAKIRGIGWSPETSFACMVERLMKADLEKP